MTHFLSLFFRFYHKKLFFIFLLVFFKNVSSQTYIPLTNYHNGISIEIQGIAGEEYVFDRYYYDPLVNDCGLCYIRSDIPISLAHNENNTRIEKSSAVIIGGDFGEIRYKIDQDFLKGVYWAGDNGPEGEGRAVYPAYNGPISFDQMTYRSGESIVGNTGFSTNDFMDRDNLFAKGMTDLAGNEYHYFTYADDDDAEPNWKNLEMSSSDGKSILFCVNPKTPAIWLSTTTPSAEYYTTPAKIYWMPKIHEQISYVTDSVDIQLANIMDSNPVNYRIDGGAYQEYSGPISSNTFSDGEHLLEFYYNEEYVQSRKIIKNPEHPCKNDVFEDGSGHGYLLWRNEDEFSGTRDRALNGYWSSSYNSYKRELDEVIDIAGNNGIRDASLGKNALGYAIVAVFEGVEDNTKYMDAAKMRLLNNKRMHIENIGFELNHSADPNPSHELTYRGYYDDGLLYANAFAYDLVAKFYRSDQFPGGITPIEDLRIRDMLAVPVYEGMMNFGGYTMGADPAVDPSPVSGMWTTARQEAAVMAALAMPSYNTHYLGTSGFDGTKASHPWTPYPDYPASWKDAYLTYTDKDNPAHVAMLHPFPNRNSLFNWFDGTLDDGLIRSDGSWHDRTPYASTSLMGHGIEYFYNVMKRKFNMTYPNIDLFMKHSINGTLTGHKFSNESDYKPAAYPRRNMANEYFPELAPIAIDANDENNKYFYRTRPYHIFFHNPDWVRANMPEDTVVDDLEVKSLSVAPAELNLYVGQKSELKEIVMPEGAVDKSVTWSSNNTDVVTVDENGVVSALSIGLATITVKTNDGGYTAESIVTVQLRPDLGNGYMETFGLGTGDVGSYKGWDQIDPIFYSGDYEYPGGCGVESTPVSEGYEGASGGSNIHIKPGYNGTAWFIIEGINTSNLTDINLSFGMGYESWAAVSNLSVCLSTNGTTWDTLSFSTVGGATWEKITISNIPSAENLRLKFEESTRKAIYIDDVKITGTTINVPVSGINISQTSATLELGKDIKIEGTVVPLDATNKSITWSSNNNSVAIVDSNGNVSAVSTGNSIITATTVDGNFAVQCSIVVVDSNIPTGITDAHANTHGAFIYPNPIEDSNFTLVFNKTQNNKQVVIKIYDITGKIVFCSNEKFVDNTNKKIELKLNQRLNTGLYILSVENHLKSLQLKIAVK